MLLRKDEEIMSEEVKRVGRDLAYEGTVIKVYKDHMKFANGN